MEERPQEENAEREEKSEEESPEVEGHVVLRKPEEGVEEDNVVLRNKGVEGKDDLAV